ncbi:sensory histidine kinase AtoS [Legionella steigerwaltii]|uniref:histidine kinase n=1 Tax=Legionella steigerwaltii TaxID=460 RepID=A0A378L9U5_9GAMM|nr:histidine kinase [Legionella steigerwaltii]KTD71658.1 sensory histidine kinase AtoS [Legionella steigerwaltii]STY23825.1 sensory histidine kinase AtoS [Legionella steigerwaltii]
MKKEINESSHTCNISKLVHEINQPLTAIKAYLGGCELRLQKNDLSSVQMMNVLQTINKHIELLQKKIYSLHDLIAQENFIAPQSIDVLITEITSLYSYEIEYHNIGLSMDFHANIPDLPINKLPLKQVLFRLLKHCIATVEENKIQNAQLEIQTIIHEDAINIMIKSNLPMKEDNLERELAYCRTLLNVNNGTLSADLLANGICFQIIITKGNGYAI